MTAGSLGRRILTLLVVAVVACGQSDEERLCQAGDRLQAEVIRLDGLSLLGQQSKTVSTHLAGVEDAFAGVRKVAYEVAAGEIDDLEASIDQARAQVDAIGADGITVESGAAVILALLDLVPTAASVVATLEDACT